MGKVSKIEFRTHLLNLVAMQDEMRKESIRVGEEQQRLRQRESELCKQTQAVLEIWKKGRSHWIGIEHCLLPDNRVAVLQEGAITVWELRDLRTNT